MQKLYLVFFYKKHLKSQKIDWTKLKIWHIFPIYANFVTHKNPQIYGSSSIYLPVYFPGGLWSLKKSLPQTSFANLLTEFLRGPLYDIGLSYWMLTTAELWWAEFHLNKPSRRNTWKSMSSARVPALIFKILNLMSIKIKGVGDCQISTLQDWKK